MEMRWRKLHHSSEVFAGFLPRLIERANQQASSIQSPRWGLFFDHDAMAFRHCSKHCVHVADVWPCNKALTSAR